MRVFIVFVGLIIVLFATSLVFLIFPNAFPPYLRDDLASRIGMAQWSIELASLIALGLAVWEFRQAQKKPDLRLWLQVFEKDDLIYSDRDEIEVAPNSRDVRAYATFNLLLENKGQAAARWVKISLVFDNDNKIARNFLRMYSYSEYWTPKSIQSPRLDFNGGDDFVSYSHPEKIEAIAEWAEKLGTISAEPYTGFDLMEKKVRINCYVEAFDFHRKIQTFTFHIKKPNLVKTETVRSAK